VRDERLIARNTKLWKLESLKFVYSFIRTMSYTEIFFIGRVNAGKSTLIKKLFGLKTRVGGRPGVTQTPIRYQINNLTITDLPGLGFKRGLKSYGTIVPEMIDYARQNTRRQLLGVHVIDARSFIDVLEAHSTPLDVEIFEYLLDLEIEPIVAVNKMDKIREPELSMDAIVSRLGMLPPYKQWADRVVPVSAKKGQVGQLAWLLKQRCIA